MEDLVYLKPTDPDAIVRDPLTRRPLAAEGEEKPLSTYWRRRLKAGEVVRASKPKASKTLAKQES